MPCVVHPRTRAYLGIKFHRHRTSYSALDSLPPIPSFSPITAQHSLHHTSKLTTQFPHGGNTTDENIDSEDEHSEDKERVQSNSCVRIEVEMNEHEEEENLAEEGSVLEEVV